MCSTLHFLYVAAKFWSSLPPTKKLAFSRFRELMSLLLISSSKNMFFLNLRYQKQCMVWKKWILISFCSSAHLSLSCLNLLSRRSRSSFFLLYPYLYTSCSSFSLSTFCSHWITFITMISYCFCSPSFFHFLNVHTSLSVMPFLSTPIFVSLSAPLSVSIYHNNSPQLA